MVNVMLKNRTLLTIVAASLMAILLIPAIGNAAPLVVCTEDADCDTVKGEVCLQGKCSDPFGVDLAQEGLAGTLASDDGSVDLIGTIANIINIMLSLLGILAVIIVLIAGFKWMTAGGNDEKVTEARKLLFSGVIGLAIILAAWAIARFVIDSLQGAIQVNS